MVQDQTLSYNKYDKTVSLQQRIETQTEITDTCWIWRGYANGSKSNLRGKVSRKGRQVSVTRLVWELTYGSIPLGLNVLHTCDVTLCIRPSHLFLGTQQDNVDDILISKVVRRRIWIHIT
jgi:hypothetical protein